MEEIIQFLDTQFTVKPIDFFYLSNLTVTLGNIGKMRIRADRQAGEKYYIVGSRFFLSY